MILIERTHIDEFIKDKKLGNLVDFFQHLHDHGTHELKAFLQFKDIVIEPVDKVLLHGSGERMETIEPQVSTGGMNENKYKPLVYATPSANYSIFMATIRLRKGHASFSVRTKESYELSIGLDFVNGPSTFEEGFIYVFDASTFEKQSAYEYTSEQSPKILFVIKVNPQDLTHCVVVDFTRK